MAVKNKTKQNKTQQGIMSATEKNNEQLNLFDLTCIAIMMVTHSSFHIRCSGFEIINVKGYLKMQ